MKILYKLQLRDLLHFLPIIHICNSLEAYLHIYVFLFPLSYKRNVIAFNLMKQNEFRELQLQPIKYKIFNGNISLKFCQRPQYF